MHQPGGAALHTGEPAYPDQANPKHGLFKPFFLFLSFFLYCIT